MKGHGRAAGGPVSSGRPALVRRLAQTGGLTAKAGGKDDAMTRLSAARVVATAFGIGAGLLGLEHGYFETLQGNAAPSGLVISAHDIQPASDSRPAHAWPRA
jgi:hypothetical protein